MFFYGLPPSLDRPESIGNNVTKSTLIKIVLNIMFNEKE